MTTGMGRSTINSGLIALLFPIVMYLAKDRIHNDKIWRVLQSTVFVFYLASMFYFSLVGRSPGERSVNLIPFWTYSFFSDPEYRWEIYMNIFLFLPFGFMLSFAGDRNFFQSLLIGFAFSVIIETVQYIFSLGMCEFDDVFHNSLGTALGYGYWKALLWMRAKHRLEISSRANRMMLFARKLGARGMTEIKMKLKRGSKK